MCFYVLILSSHQGVLFEKFRPSIGSLVVEKSPTDWFFSDQNQQAWPQTWIFFNTKKKSNLRLSKDVGSLICVRFSKNFETGIMGVIYRFQKPTHASPNTSKYVILKGDFGKKIQLATSLQDFWSTTPRSETQYYGSNRLFVTIQNYTITIMLRDLI